MTHQTKQPCGCPVCHGTTWLPVKRTDPQTGRDYQAVTSCTCTPRWGQLSRKAQKRQLALVAEAKQGKLFAGKVLRFPGAGKYPD